MSGKRSRTKGHSFERDTAIKLRKIFPKARRQLEYQIEDCVGVDIAHTGDYKFQCKKLKRYASINTIKEILCARELGDVPVLVTAGDFAPTMAVMYFDDLIELIAKAEKRK